MHDGPSLMETLTVVQGLVALVNIRCGWRAREVLEQVLAISLWAHLPSLLHCMHTREAQPLHNIALHYCSAATCTPPGSHLVLNFAHPCTACTPRGACAHTPHFCTTSTASAGGQARHFPVLASIMKS
eukprot:1148011-Pelagomonas_calceolata.AAC.13